MDKEEPVLPETCSSGLQLEHEGGWGGKRLRWSGAWPVEQEWDVTGDRHSGTSVKEPETCQARGLMSLSLNSSAWPWASGFIFSPFLFFCKMKTQTLVSQGCWEHKVRYMSVPSTMAGHKQVINTGSNLQETPSPRYC